MKFFGRISGKSVRWSIGTSFFLYAVLFTLIKVFKIPPKSRFDGEETDREREYDEAGKRLEVDNIVDYLHKLHNLKGTLQVREGEKKLVQPFHTVKEVFHKADRNGDNYLNSDEITKWINVKTQEHIHEAIVDNYKTFLTIDVRPKNGLISWEEYHSYFLQRNGLTQNNSAVPDGVPSALSGEKLSSRKVQEAIMRGKAAWSETAKNDPAHLNLDEFLSFRHPESSYTSIIYLVDEIFKKFDTDADEVLTEDEFSTVRGDEDDERPKSMTQEENERRREFREMVDLNKDGTATRKEMLAYVDPKNPRHAKEEADTLIELADVDGDGRLSLDEIFNKMDIFLGSKMIDAGDSFHDEL
ncbi:hypothetical protein RUM43_011010 [Polyplax serrata]|uniref:EF-hand domain-containing protein n=1 Tax=Polyplax serrata TaxID=468196 RepID=A0AAN8RZN7_POLSC